jgi:hypothetical protein
VEVDTNYVDAVDGEAFLSSAIRQTLRPLSLIAGNPVYTRFHTSSNEWTAWHNMTGVMRVSAELRAAIEAEGFNTSASGGTLANLLAALPSKSRHEGYVSIIRGDAANPLNVPPVGGNGITGYMTIYKESSAYVKVRLKEEGDRTTSVKCSEWEGEWLMSGSAPNATATWQNTGQYASAFANVLGWQPIYYDSGWVTWTPQFRNSSETVLTGGTFSGKYRRIGNRVCGYARWTATTTVAINSLLTLILPYPISSALMPDSYPTPPGIKCHFMTTYPGTETEGMTPGWGTGSDKIAFGMKSASHAVQQFGTISATGRIVVSFDYLVS